ncbi:MAG: hypothetical protein R3C56_21725 [Pirellulaceae bacterium]
MHIPALKKLLADANIPLTIDDGVEDVWLVSELNTSSLVPNWEVGYATVSKTLDVRGLAVAMGWIRGQDRRVTSRWSGLPSRAGFSAAQ